MSSPNLPALKKLSLLDRSSPGFHDRLSNALYKEEYQQCVPNVQGDDLVWLVDYLDKALVGLESSSAASRKCLRELRSICGAKGILPTSYTLLPHLLHINPDPFTSGGYGDVYQGTLNDSNVCVKRIRVYTQEGPQEATKIFCQEAVVWKRLAHPNILPLLGITITPIQLISSWMSGGDLPGYIRMNSSADRLRLISDVARGLRYLHACNVVHGDLKGPNVLVDHSGNALIADFGLATVTQNLDSVRSPTHQPGHTPRWAAPEVLTQGIFSKEADTFSFAMVMIEVFTGAIPFSGKTTTMATFHIIEGVRPQRPAHPALTTELWALMERCWNPDPHLRPEVSEALNILRDTGNVVRTWGVNSTPAVGPPRSLTLPKDIQRFVDRIKEHCSKMPVAKKGSMLITVLCDDLAKRLGEPSLILQQSNYEDIRRVLVHVEEQLARWSKWCLLSSLMRKSEIKRGIAECVERLDRLLRDLPIPFRGLVVQPAPDDSAGDQGPGPPGRREGDGIFQSGVAGDKPTSVVIDAGPNQIRFGERLSRRRMGQETQESQQAESSKPLSVQRLDGSVTRMGEVPFAGGIHCEVWVGRWDKGGKIGGEEADPEKVALKVLRASGSSVGSRKRLYGALPRWAELHHQNILPLYGIVTDLGPRVYMVSPWQENGNLLDYVRTNPAAIKNDLLCGSAAGLSYLHSRDVLHGSVKCNNVLVSRKGEPRVCDFEIARVVEEGTESTVSKTASGDIVRYGAPELIETYNACGTKASDAYSFAMLILECITEKKPFHHLTRDAAVVHVRIDKKVDPPRPHGQDPKKGVSDDLWSLMTRCWSREPNSRPTMEEVHSFLLFNV